MYSITVSLGRRILYLHRWSNCHIICLYLEYYITMLVDSSRKVNQKMFLSIDIVDILFFIFLVACSFFRSILQLPFFSIVANNHKPYRHKLELLPQLSAFCTSGVECVFQKDLLFSNFLFTYLTI